MPMFHKMWQNKWINAAVAVLLRDMSLSAAVSILLRVWNTSHAPSSVSSVIGVSSPAAVFGVLLIPCGAPVAFIVSRSGCGKTLKLYVAGTFLLALAVITYATLSALWL